MDFYRNRRVISTVCALVMLAAVLLPTRAFAAEAEEQAVPQTLTAAEVRQMQQADALVTELTDSNDYAQMDCAEREAAARAQLDTLVEQGLVEEGSVYTDEENGMISFTYTCGALGGILLTDPDEENAAQIQMEANPNKQTVKQDLGSAVIYYAFDNTVNSSRYPNYAYMQSYWTSVGLETQLDTRVTVSDLRHMGDYDLCILGAHGAYYTYQYGWLWKRQATEPIILLTEESDFWTDLRYGGDLLNHRVIKINGMYAITAGFFSNAYRKGELKDTIVISETCEFYGRSGHVDNSLADALLNGGAKAVVGYINNVYSVYSRSMMWTMVNRMLSGDTIQEAMEFGQDRYGENDIVWYNAQGGRKPHAMASYPIIRGQKDARMTELEPQEKAASQTESENVSAVQTMPDASWKVVVGQAQHAA